MGVLLPAAQSALTTSASFTVLVTDRRSRIRVELWLPLNPRPSKAAEDKPTKAVYHPYLHRHLVPLCPHHRKTNWENDASHDTLLDVKMMLL
jgi:hypothetical protein